jgi:hypothetical protein
LFLGNIASPGLSVTPMGVLKQIWSGTLPPFDTMDDANERIRALEQFPLNRGHILLRQNS